MKPEQLARRPLRKARVFTVAAMFPGDRLDSERATRVQVWLDEYRYWQKRLNSPYIPYFGYRFDLPSYADEPEYGWDSFESAYVRIPQARIDAKLQAFRAAGFAVQPVPRFAKWSHKLRSEIDGVAMNALPYCKGESNRGAPEAGRPKRCACQTPILDPEKVISRAISHCIEAMRAFGLQGANLGCKRAFYSPNEAGEFKVVFGPGPGESPAGGPLLAPPFEHGYWDAAWIKLARALRDEGYAIVKQERPRGFPDQTGASWLPEDLRAHVTEEGGPERP